MKPGDSFNDGGSRWIALEVAQDQNRHFTWLKVLASWSGFGMMPLRAKENRTFFMDRKARQ